MADETEANLREAAAAPKRYTTDDTTTEQHPLKDRIATEQYLAKRSAVKKKGFGIRRFKFVPPSATNE